MPRPRDRSSVSPSEPAPFPRWGWALLLPGALLALMFASAHEGVLWPDETFQSLEPAHRLAFGYGFVAWEFQRGARSWIFPGALAGVLKLADLLGHGSPAVLLGAARAFMVLVASVGSLAGLRLAYRLGGTRALVLAAAILGMFPAQLYFAGRAMSEVASGAALVWTAWLCLDERASRLRVAGALTALAILLRPPNAVFACALAVALLVERRGRARPFLAGFAVMAAAGGALDWITWGAPFHSVALYVRYNLFEGHAADYGRAPFGYYARTLWTSTGPALLVIAAGLTRLPKAARVPLVAAGAAIAVHLLLAHKELRFLAPYLPVLFAVAAAGLAHWLGHARVHLAWFPATAASVVLALGLATAMTARARVLTYAELGYPEVPWYAERAGDFGDRYNLLLQRLHDTPDLCGVAVAGAAVIWLGGYTPLHRDVPFFDLDPPRPEGSPAANYVIVPSHWTRPATATLIAYYGGAALYRYDHPCAPPPIDYRLFELPAGL